MIIFLTIFNSVVLFFVAATGLLFLYYKHSKQSKQPAFNESMIKEEKESSNINKIQQNKTKKIKGRVNISQGAKMVGKSRTTIHRKINNGDILIKDGTISKRELLQLFAPNEKHCGHCGKIKNKLEFSYKRNSKSGLQSWCKQCMNNNSKARNKKTQEKTK